MRREERQHLKANPLARIVGRWQDTIRLHAGRFVVLLVAIFVVLLGIGGYGLWGSRANDLAGEALAEALQVLRSEVVAPPTAETETNVEWVQPEGTYVSQEEKFEEALIRLQEISVLYGGSSAGVTAQYQAASVLILLERFDEAIEQFRGVIDSAGSDLYGGMARLGLAEACILSERYDEAIQIYEDESVSSSTTAPTEAILMRLAYAYELAGQKALALATYNRVVDEFPLSVYSRDAAAKLEMLEIA
tara:strand:+ start:7378 stop:8121 length:744 start_codon:yes stop_codon:yes gene_type:complete